MLDKVKFNVTNRYYVIGISLKNEIYSYNLITIYYKNSILRIENFLALDTFEECLSSLNKDFPVLLYIENENVLNKVSENNENYKRKLIFNAEIKDFYFYEYIQDNKIFTSVVRKKIINNYISEIKKINRFVIHVSIGPFVLANLTSFISDKILRTENYLVDIKSEKIISFKKHEESGLFQYEINGDILSQKELGLFASFIDFKNQNSNIVNDVSFLSENKIEYKYKTLIKKVGLIMLIVILSTLFLSHFLSVNYESEFRRKNIEYQLTQQISNEYEVLKKEKSLKEVILRKSGIVNSNFITKYINDIGNSINKNIFLKSINTFPLKKKIRENEEVELESNIIIIEGETVNDNSFNLWTISIEAFTWVKKVNILEYSLEEGKIKKFVIKLTI